ncbi:MAG TPA: phosphodiester glycosidase family protein [Acidimicrobiales bacterium]|nr:phosphodiester glycosidase family protein [Acidimicrobiales bacterium]
MQASLVVAVVGLLVLLAGAGPAEAMADVPGTRTAEVRTLAPGVEYRRIVRDDGPVVAHVVAVRKGAGLAVRAVLSNDRVAGPDPAQERTSAMCQRVRCIAAVNADFAFPSGQPVGAVAVAGQLLRSPVPTHHQLSVTAAGDLAAGTLGWSAQLVASDLVPVPIVGLNVDRQADAVVLYTPTYGPSTATNEFGAELVVKLVEPTQSLRIRRTAMVELVSFGPGRGNTAIPVDGAVLSGHGTGATALADLWGRQQRGVVSRRGLLRVETAPDVTDSVGGTPVLVHEGRRWVADDGSNFVAGRHPRTIVGWNDAEVLLVTVDGRQPGYSVGVSLPEAAELLRALGATEAINLDGGGSTTLATGATVLNRPSDRMVRRGGKQQVVHELRPGDVLVGAVERPVASGLAIVPKGPVAPAPLDPFAAGATVVIPDVDPAPHETDPASIPGGGNTALLDLGAPPAPTPALIAVAAGFEVAVAQWLLIIAVRQRRQASNGWRNWRWGRPG